MEASARNFSPRRAEGRPSAAPRSAAQRSAGRANRNGIRWAARDGLSRLQRALPTPSVCAKLRVLPLGTVQYSAWVGAGGRKRRNAAAGPIVGG